MTQSTSLKLGIAGLGTVGASVIRQIQDNAGLLTDRTGRTIEIVAVSARDRHRDRGVDLTTYAFHDDARTLAQQDDIDVIVELIGGSEGIARDLVEQSLKSGKHVVTANKALLAHHGHQLATLADAANVGLAYEAAVAGGIPIVKALREGLAANNVRAVHGILNGTCNYILTKMRETGESFGEVLKEAQELGYAEADPTFDVEGIDAAHKLALLASMAFGTTPAFDAIHRVGISEVDSDDNAFAEELGYCIRLIGSAVMSDSGLEQSMLPCLVPLGSPFGSINGVTNAVILESDELGSVMLSGPGAGGDATASAVLSDVVDIARGRITPAFTKDTRQLVAPNLVSEHHGKYYLRLNVIDQAGMLAELSQVLKSWDISIQSLLQRGHNPGKSVPIVILTHDTTEKQMSGAIGALASIDGMVSTPRCLRVQHIV